MKDDVSKKDIERAKLLARQHWDYLQSRIGLFYKDAFIHGYKHAIEDMKNGDRK